MDHGTTYERTRLAMWALRRLDRFAKLGGNATLPPAAIRLARHATLSAYRDCVEIGCEDDAHLVLIANNVGVR